MRDRATLLWCSTPAVTARTVTSWYPFGRNRHPEMLAEINVHASVQAWFDASFASPTPVQSASWPVIASGAHALITAPTGSGKTLTAFLWALSQFAEGVYPSGQTSVLYISPLKALNNDIERNLNQPLRALREEHGFPDIRVALRSGDTSTGDRARLLRNPPDILITTPESLGLMLTTHKGRMALAHVKTLILDEVHSLVDNRRGVTLMTNAERLVDIAGEFQRIALSATVHPLEAVAEYVAGLDQHRQPREVNIINPAGTKNIAFRVRFPPEAREAAEQGKKIWDPLAKDFKAIIAENTSTLFFANSRRLTEKITLKINQDEVAPVAYAHHGSLAREVRTEVESRLKRGELKAIVATNSLEMGIDVGALDEVVLVQSPPSVAAALQRIGRAGHRVGETSIGTLYPTHTQDFLAAATLAEAIEDRDIEPLKPMVGALDVLAQLIISITATDAWSVDAVFALVTRASPYRSLAREQFDLVVEMLAGRYTGSRIRELKPRISYDRIKQTIQANKGAVLALYSSGGTIPDRGYFKMRHVDTGGVLGELDEEFVWEATIGDTFTLGTQHWQIHRITHNDVIVRAAKAGNSAPPFWRSETFNRSFHFSSRIAQYLEMQDQRLAENGGEAIVDELVAERGFQETAAIELTDFLKRQREHTQSSLPHRHHLVLELVKSGPAGYRGPDDPQQLVMHTYWGGRLNQPFALALKSAWREAMGDGAPKLDVHADNNAIVVQCKGDIDPHQIVNLVQPGNLLTHLRSSLEQSGFFGARFRECAGRSLLLTRQRFNQRLPLWMSRLQAKKLMSQVKQLESFPVLLETWRTCLDDEFDLDNLMSILQEIQDGVIEWSFVTTTTPSPFAQDLTFNQVSRYMYADDTPEDDSLSLLGDDLITQAVHNDALRPTIDPTVVEEFEAKRQRTFSGYAPEEPDDWHEWLKERILIPAAELEGVLDPTATELEYGHWIDVDGRRWLTHLELVQTLYASGFIPGTHPEHAPDVIDSRSALQFAREILSFYGPRSAAEIEALLPSVPEDLFTEDDTFLEGQLVAPEGNLPPDSPAPTPTPTQWCDAENFEILLRMQRAQRRAVFEPLNPTELPLFWAGLHRLHAANDSPNIVYALESLRAYPAHVRAWTSDLLASRVRQVSPHDIDEVFLQQGMRWLGTGPEQISLGYPEELELLSRPQPDEAFSAYFTDPAASYRFEQIAEAAGETPGSLNATWWDRVWSGQLTSETLAPLREGMSRKFELADIAGNTTSRRRMRRSPRGWSGHWHLTDARLADDPLTQLENDKERVRLLLDRYGFLCREIVNREAGDNWRWRDAFRALRIMELAGEVLCGQFFTGLGTPQFASPSAFSQLRTRRTRKESFWISCQDPVSPCGLSLDWEDLPHRRAGNYLSFVDGQLALSVTANGRALQYSIAWNDDHIDEANGLLTYLVDELGQRIVVQSINDKPARGSPYLDSLERQFDVATDHKHVLLQPRY